MIEDILATLSSEGFAISNTFQTTEIDVISGGYGPVGWAVYLRNNLNGRTGIGQGVTLEEALRDAYAKAMVGEATLSTKWWERSGTSGAKPPRTYVPPPRIQLGPAGEVSSDTSEELF